LLLEFQTDPRLLIRRRVSVRTYSPTALSEGDRRELEKACGALARGPLGSPCRFRLLEGRPGAPAGRLGTYGVVRGARSYLAGAAGAGPHALEDFGYLFELLILKATERGLGTCWLGGTFRRSSFARALELEKGEVLPAVSPVGVPAGSLGAVDRLFRWGARSQHRRPWAQLFFDAATKGPLSFEAAGPYAEALEMVRLAPSAYNRQPWRLLLDGGEVHFYLQRSPGYGAAAGVDLQRLDMGIAMAHFQLSLPAPAAEGRWRLLEPEAAGALAAGLRAEAPGAAAPAAAASGAAAGLRAAAPAFQKVRYVVSWQPGA
jgi:nitroreductase